MSTTADIAQAVARERKLVYWRNYYDENRERILARQMARYQETREARKAARLAASPEASGAPKKKRGPKPKPREVVITVGYKSDVCVGR